MDTMAKIEDFLKLDIRVGTVLSAKLNEKAIKPSYILTIDFGEDIGIKGSSAQICQNYLIDELIGMQVTAVINFPARRVAGFKSEVLVLAIVCSKNGTVLVTPNKPVKNGEKLA